MRALPSSLLFLGAASFAAPVAASCFGTEAEWACSREPNGAVRAIVAPPHSGISADVIFVYPDSDSSTPSVGTHCRNITFYPTHMPVEDGDEILIFTVDGRCERALRFQDNGGLQQDMASPISDAQFVGAVLQSEDYPTCVTALEDLGLPEAQPCNDNMGCTAARADVALGFSVVLLLLPRARRRR